MNTWPSAVALDFNFGKWLAVCATLSRFSKLKVLPTSRPNWRFGGNPNRLELSLQPGLGVWVWSDALPLGTARWNRGQRSQLRVCFHTGTNEKSPTSTVTKRSKNSFAGQHNSPRQKGCAPTPTQLFSVFSP